MVYQGGCGGLTVRTGNTDHLRVGIAPRKLNLTDDMNTFLNSHLYHRSRFGDTRTLNDLVGIENLFLSMLSFFPFNLSVIQHFFVLIGNLRHV